jgi:hypothetical protein
LKWAKMKGLTISVLFVSALCISCGNHSTATPQSGNSSPTPAETQKTDSAQLPELEQAAFVKEFDEQLDVTLGTVRRTDQLADELLRWHKVDAEDRRAMRVAEQLCEWNRRSAKAIRNWSAMEGAHEKEIDRMEKQRESDRLQHRHSDADDAQDHRSAAMQESMELVRGELSKARQLQAMGWSCKE